MNLSESQRQDVADLLELCRTFNVDAIIIGATAYRLLMEDDQRHTLDIDLALALDVDAFLRFEVALTAMNWQHSSHEEQRWTTARGNRFDLLPAGPRLRKEGRLVWPRTGFVMSLAGFEHVFRRAVVQDVGGGLQVKVVPPAVLALLKMASYLDDPILRAKDLDDVKRLLRWYDHESARIFSDVVLEADLPDVEFASAFLLGLDMSGIAEDSDRRLVESFLALMNEAVAAAHPATSSDADWATREILRFERQLTAFEKAFSRPTS